MDYPRVVTLIILQCVYLKRFYRKDINSYLLIHPMDEIYFLKLKIRQMYVTEPKQKANDQLRL